MNIIVLVVIATSGLTAVSGLQCYSCNVLEKGCADTFNKDGITIETCTADQYCYKLSAKASTISTGKRSCQQDLGKSGLKCVESKAGDAATASCYCNTDLCNTAGQQMTSILAIVAGIIVTLAGMELFPKME